MTDEPAVRNALRDFAESLFRCLREADFALPPEELRGSGWVAVGDAFVLRDYQEWPFEVRHQADEMKGETEYDRAIAALKAHPVIGPRLDELVGGWTLDADSVPPMLVFAMLSTDNDGLTFDEACFEREFARLYAWLTRDVEAVVVIAPLSGLDSDEVPIPLAPGIEIDRMTDEEVIACLRTGVIAPMALGNRAWVDPRVGVRIREQHPLGIGDGFMAAEPLQGRIEPIQAIVNALRLLKPGKVTVSGMVDMPEASYQGAYRFTPISGMPHRPFKTYALDPGEGDRLAGLWGALRDERVTGRLPLVIAIRRFGFAGERSRPDDQLLDLMIAAEAVFLAGEKSENRDKLSLRAALFLHDPDRPPREIARFFRAAYDARSFLAHGEEPKLKALDGAAGTMERYVTRLSDYLRLALRAMIETASRDDPLPFDDWDKFTFDRLASE